jgi:hypothetical protein
VFGVVVVLLLSVILRTMQASLETLQQRGWHERPLALQLLLDVIQGRNGVEWLVTNLDGWQWGGRR